MRSEAPPPNRWLEGARIPILLVQAAPGISRKGLDPSLFNLLIARDKAGPSERERWMAVAHARGVRADRIGQVLRTGIDVSPSDSPIFAEQGLDKALEYGCDGDQLLVLLNVRKLKRTFREVPADSDPSLLTELRRSFQTELKSTDGKQIWFSRLGKDGTVAGTSYERDFAWWNPGDPWEALLGLIVLSQNALDATEVFVRNELAAAQSKASIETA
jgi:hypothetical protein